MQLAAGEKAPGAFLTIGELSHELGVAQHILRYWETKFPQLRPLQRAGNRRYYRPGDVDLARRIHQLLNEQGYTVRGVQQLLRSRGSQSVGAEQQPEQPPARPPETDAAGSGIDIARLTMLRNRLADALDS